MSTDNDFYYFNDDGSHQTFNVRFIVWANGASGAYMPLDIATKFVDESQIVNAIEWDHQVMVSTRELRQHGITDAVIDKIDRFMHMVRPALVKMVGHKVSWTF